MPSKILVEIAVNSVERAKAAERGGADRLELCADLPTGGVSPSAELVAAVQRAVKIPVHVMVRPRAGNFVYGDAEFARMREEIVWLKRAGAEGVVIGLMTADGRVDVARTKELVTFAAPLNVTFHRAVDEARDLFAAVEDVIACGVNRVLTSGGEASCLEGVGVLKELLERSCRRIVILPGGGLHSGNVTEFLWGVGAAEVHSGLGSVISYEDGDSRAFEAEVGRFVRWVGMVDR